LPAVTTYRSIQIESPTRSEDDFELINCEGALQVIDYSENFIRELVTLEKRPKFGKPVPFRFGIGIEQEGDKVVVTGVSRGSIAANAGVEKGDVIVEFGGETITKRRQVFLLVGKFKGQEVNLKLKRDGEKIEMDVELKTPE